jgi:hypothetical protein
MDPDGWDKFKGPYMHFWERRDLDETLGQFEELKWELRTSLRTYMCISSTGIGMRAEDKFKDGRWNLLLSILILYRSMLPLSIIWKQGEHLDAR